MQSLNLPSADLQIRTDADKQLVFDSIRKTFVTLTDEEWVRQHFLRFLTDQRNVPAGLIAIEKAFLFQGMTRRADIVVYGRDGNPWLVVECKAPDISLGQSVFDQVGRYNSILNATYVGVTNGLDHFCFQANHRELNFLDDFPYYNTNTHNTIKHNTNK